MKYWTILMLGLLAMQNTFADEMEISLSDKIVDGSYDMFFSNNFGIRFSLMHSDIDNVDNADVSDPYTNWKQEDSVKTDMINVGLFANNEFGNVHTRLGGKIYYLNTEHHNDLLGAAVGGSVDAYVTPTIFFTGEAFYSPDIITNGDYKNYWEANARASFQILSNANLYVGYKIMAANFEWDNMKKLGLMQQWLMNDTGSRTFFDGLYLGIRFKL